MPGGVVKYQGEFFSPCLFVQIVQKVLENIAVHLVKDQCQEFARCGLNAANHTLPDMQTRGRCGRFGAFPGKRSPRVLWLGVISEPLQQLYQLFQFVENDLHGLGFPKERRRFAPHLTLARVKQSGNFEPLWNFVQRNPFEPFTFKVPEIVLMRSFLKPQGAEYKPLGKFAF